MNGKEAVEKVVTRSQSSCCHTYGLALMDVHMPLLDGIEATKQIRAHTASMQLPNFPIVALTADDLSKSEEEELCRTVGFTMYQRKPINKDDFMHLLHLYHIL